MAATWRPDTALLDEGTKPELVDYDTRWSDIRRDLKLLKWAIGVQFSMLLAILLKLSLHS